MSNSGLKTLELCLLLINRRYTNESEREAAAQLVAGITSSSIPLG